MLQLDGLRAIAVFGVLFDHFYGPGWREAVPIGHWSVRLFFVLSGFLITGILLRCRDLSGTRRGRLDQLRQFYVRRTLRIFPAFYLVVIIAAALNIPPVRNTLLWVVTYATNIHLALRGSWNGSISHFWSLAVEEQFYLFWPWLILFIADKYLLVCIVLSICVAPLVKICGPELALNEIAREVLTFTNFDALGVGALLALYRYKKPSHFAGAGRAPLYRWAGPVLAGLVIASLFLFRQPRFATALNDLLTSTLFAWIIHKASLGFGGVVGHLLETRPVLHCGKISYGIYLYHNFVTPEARAFCERFHLTYPQQPLWRFALFTSITIAIAAASWFGFEQPINNVKRRFRYSKP